MTSIRIPGVPGWVQRRIVFSIVVILAAIALNFLIPRLMPGDITFYMTSSTQPPSVAEGIIRRLGLDKPMITQFWIYLKDTFTFQYGNSFVSGDPVISMIKERLPRTMLLLIPAQIISLIIGYFLGVIAGWKAGGTKDSFITGSSLIIWAMPMFWVGMVVLYIFAYLLGWFPLSGFMDVDNVGKSIGFFPTIADRINHIILPTLTLATKYGAYELVMRNTMTITLKQNYIITAKAKGLSEFRVKHRHAARNAMMPTITAAAMRFATMIAGLIFIETIFSYPGMGKMIFDAVQRQDYPVIQASFLFFALVTIATIFVLDVVYARLDPRVRYD
ncbi:MAG: ABC transporter permease [Chloroflexi bacterium]|jgi:peptide/nickel transport system permease protein|nr:ABC transporter permease [Chloroflexota bacterium]MBT7082526.1 ABC transporter permease [Chloroflexota bacterium]MBT7289615.1 ABC transporter permease [Chloroflexota bacterium]